MKRFLLRLTGAATCLAMLLLTQGCTGGDPTAPPREMGKVTGTATLDGKALAGVEIIFTPVDGGGSSSAAMDDEGKYNLEYSGGGKIGAVIGQHTVSFRDAGEELDGDIPLPGGGDGMGIIPEEYTEGMSTIKREVTTGDQVIDFELKTTE